MDRISIAIAIEKSGKKCSIQIMFVLNFNFLIYSMEFLCNLYDIHGQLTVASLGEEQKAEQKN